MGKILVFANISCDPEYRTTSPGYVENNMPLLSQSDPLLQYSPYWPLLNNQEPPLGSPPVFASGDDADCYNTSIVTLLSTALANRDPSLVPPVGSRTYNLDQVAATPPVKWNPPPDATVVPAELSKSLNQLAWWVQNLTQSQNAYYISEALADLGPLFQSSPDPRNYPALPFVNLFTSNHGACFRDAFDLRTKHLSDEYIISLLENDFVVILAGNWVVPQVDSNGNVSFQVCGTHKMVVSGWQNNPFALRINVIFAAQQQCARLTPISQSDRDFGPITGGLHPPVKGSSIPASALNPPATVACPGIPGVAPMPSLISLDFVTQIESKDVATHNQFFFINQLDAFSLNWRPPQSSFDQTWGAWTHIVPFGGGSLVTYNSETGAFMLSIFAPNGAETVWEHQWTCFYTHLVPFVLNATQYFLAYNSQSGAAVYCRVNSREPGPEVVWSGTWGTGFTHFMPFEIEGAPHFIAYNGSTGLAQMDRVSPDLEGCYTRFQASWATGFTTFVPFTLEGVPGFIIYNTASGAVQFITIGLQGAVGGSQAGNDLFLTWLSSGTWAPGWTHIVSIPWPGLPHYLA